LIYRLLGDLEIGSDDDLVSLPPGLTLILLAYLLFKANRRLSHDELIRAVWGSEGGATVQQLHKRAGQVRAVLRQLGRGQDLKNHAGYGYELNAAVEDVDVLLFTRLADNAANARREKRLEEEIALLWRALRLWRGPYALSNVSTMTFKDAVVALEQRRKRAAERLFDLELLHGHHEDALSELMTMAVIYPSGRRLCEQLMLAQFRSGRLGEAAGTYQRYREALAEESGTEPDAALRDLHYAIAREDDDATLAAECAMARRAGLTIRPILAVPKQLPPVVDLFGRDDLVAEVSWLLRRESGPAVRVIVISGPGGIGKTALAVRAASDSRDRYPDGQIYLELRGTTSSPVGAREAAGQILRAFGVPRVPGTVAERVAAYRTLLADRKVLIVMDDAPGGTLVRDLLPASRGCVVLVTARQRMPTISGAHPVAPLKPLKRDDATALFRRLVEEAGVELDDDEEAVARVVKLCGGLPLALRIAGALRVHDNPRPTSELADRLAKQGPEAFEYEDLNLARTIGASLERLDPSARQLFLGLGLLPLRSFGVWTAAALPDQSEADAVANLSRLAARFMIEPLEPDLRYRFHDLTRDYARQRALKEYPGDRDAVAGGVYLALLTLVRRAHANLYGGDFELVHSGEPDWAAPAEVLAEVDSALQEWFEKERANIRAAVSHCAKLGLISICWDLAVSAHEFYTIGGHFDDWYDTHTTALDACRVAGDRRGEGMVLVCLNQPALVASKRADAATAVANLQRAVELLEESGDRHAQAIALRTLGNALRRQGHITRPLELFEVALEHYTTSSDIVGRWQTLRFTGQTLIDRGDHDNAHRALGEALTLASDLGNQRLIAQTQYWIGQAHLASGDHDGARAAFGIVFDTYRDDPGVGHAYASHGLGDAALNAGIYAEAERHFAVAAELVRDGADAVLQGRIWLSVAALHQAQHQQEEQRMALNQASAVFAGCGAVYLEIRALAKLTQASVERADMPTATKAWARVESLWNAASLPDQDRIPKRPEF
jgi:DNA-binding SARP family transcriptional activator/tetratricopeptide (TPR) repeat protein